MDKPTLLLTGGSGMVGRNILEHPLASNWNILAPTSTELDLTNSGNVTKYFNTNDIDFVIHAAGKVGGIQANINDPITFLERNTMIGRNIIMSAYHAGVQNLINLSSTCMYPRNVTNPLSEEVILSGELEPTNEGYALSKIFSTKLCQYIRSQNAEMQYCTLIPCNLYGKHDKFDPNESHLIPAIISKIHQAKITNQKTVEIWGDGTARREFMYASDLAEAILELAGEKEQVHELMNCGLGYDYSITEYYEAIADVIGWDGEFTYNLSKPTGMKQKLSSIARQTSWGWSAKTTLNEGIKLTYEYYVRRVIL